MASSASSPRILMLGPPASGKGTQCRGVVERTGAVHISAGDLLRAGVGRERADVRAAIEAGALVPDAVVVDIVLRRLLEADCEARGWVLDGFPRTAAQAEALFANGGVGRGAVAVVLEAAEESLVGRVEGRRLDPVTGRVYHVVHAPPPAGEVARRCVRRADDSAAKLRARLALYHRNLGGIVGVLRGRGTPTLRVSAEGTAADIAARVRLALGAGPAASRL